MEVETFGFREIAMAITREKGRHSRLNVGFFPEEGKYNRTSCTRCYQQYSAAQMDELMGRCPKCQGQIKLGVVDRVNLLADYAEPKHPDHRPPYLHLIPLAEIIALALGHRSAMTLGVQKLWNELTRGRTEIEVLVEADLTDLKAEPKVIEAIEAFRLGKVEVCPGGGGKYGRISLPGAATCEPVRVGQKSLSDFG